MRLPPGNPKKGVCPHFPSAGKMGTDTFFYRTLNVAITGR